MSRPVISRDLSILALPETVNTVGMRWAGICVNGKTYVLNSEGVGWDLFNVYTNGSGERDCVTDLGITREEIRQQIMQGDNGFVHLHDFIRTFGSRLESNHFMWATLLADQISLDESRV